MGQERPCFKIERMHEDGAFTFFVLSRYMGVYVYIGQDMPINELSSYLVKCIRAAKEIINGSKTPTYIRSYDNFVTIQFLPLSECVEITCLKYQTSHRMKIDDFIEVMKSELRKVKELKWNIK